MQLGKLIKYHRTRQGITQKELANGICSISYLSKIENGSITPNNDVIKLITSRLNISIQKDNDNNDEIKEKIFYWYRLIKERDKEKAKQKWKELENIYYTTSNLEAKQLLAVMKFIYEITFNNINQVKETYEKVKEAKSLFDNETLYYFYKFESLYFYYLNDLNAALVSLKQCEKIYDKIDLIDYDLYYNLSFFYKKTYQMQKSNYYAYTLLTLAQKNINIKFIINANMILAANYIRLGEYNSAEEILLKLKENVERNNVQITALIHHNLGYIYYQWNNLDKALNHLETALEYHINEFDKIDTLFILALVYNAKGNKDKLDIIISKGKQLANKLNYKKFIYKFYILEKKIAKKTLDLSFISKLEKEIVPYF